MAQRRPEDQMEIDAIDSMLGATPRVKPPIESPMPVVNEMPRVGSPFVPQPPGPPETFLHEPDEPTQVGARGGARTMTPAPAPPPPPASPPATDTPPGGGAPAPTDRPPTLNDMSGPSARSSSAGNFQEAYNTFTGSSNPNASQQDMEAAITAAFGNVPGFRGAYKESVNINGTWYDLVSGYGGPNASFQMLPKTGGGSGVGMDFMQLGSAGGGSIGTGALGGESRLDAILAAIDAMSRGVDSPIQKQAIDQELAAPAPLTDPTAMLQQAQAQTRPGRARAGVV